MISWMTNTTWLYLFEKQSFFFCFLFVLAKTVIQINSCMLSKSIYICNRLQDCNSSLKNIKPRGLFKRSSNDRVKNDSTNAMLRSEALLLSALFSQQKMSRMEQECLLLKPSMQQEDKRFHPPSTDQCRGISQVIQ